MKKHKWAWCDICKWVGSVPPYLPNYWSNEKSAAMHRKGTGHKVKMMTFIEIFGDKNDRRIT